MLYKYMKVALERIMKAPQANQYSPQMSRSWELPDGTLVVADTFDKTEMDNNETVNSPSFLDFFRSKQKPPVMGQMSPSTALTAAEFSQRFLTKFNQLANVKDEHPAETGAPMGATGDAEKPAE